VLAAVLPLSLAQVTDHSIAEGKHCGQMIHKDCGVRLRPIGLVELRDRAKSSPELSEPDDIHARKRLKLACAALLLPLVCAAGCNWETPTSVIIREGPSFEFAGSGRLAKFTVYAPATGRRIAVADSQVSTPIWQIVSSKGYFEGDRVNGLRVVYGKVPQGYTQTIPKPSDEPKAPPLGVICAFFAETVNAPGIGGSIFMTPTGPVPVKVADYCLRLINGHEVEVNCQTNAPYQEPADLEKYVQQHRIVR
jgi:hypothetical protein